MKYIIMAGGKYQKWKTPRHLTPIDGEPLIARTIRQLKEHGVEDIAISSNDPIFEQFGVPVLQHENSYDAKGYNDFTGFWCDAFYLTDEPTCYIFGDVFFSPEAIETIVNTETDDIEFFASAPPFSRMYKREWAEPYGFKVVNYKRFFDCISLAKHYEDIGKFHREAISWELWQVIKDTPLNKIDYTNYTVINDYTVDIDDEWDVKMLEELIKEIDNG